MSLYKIHPISREGSGSAVYGLTLDPCHKIFAGHFPGAPVVPGVCLIDIAAEITKSELGSETAAPVLEEVSNAKFLSVLSPENSSDLQAKITIKSTGEKISSTVVIYDSSTQYAKISLNFRP